MSEQPNKVKLLDLDAANIDVYQTAPDEFVKWLFEQEGVISVWSAKLGEPGGSTAVWRWLSAISERWHHDTQGAPPKIVVQLAPIEKPAGEGVEEIMPATALRGEGDVKTSGQPSDTGSADVSGRDDGTVSGTATSERRTRRLP